MKFWTRRFPLVGLLFGVGLCWTLPAASASAKDVVGVFVQTVGGNAQAKKNGAMLNWIAREVVRRAQNNVQLLNRGLFFSRSQALSAQRWRKKAANVAEEGYQSYLSDPAEALRFMFRAARFYEYAYTYAMDRQGTRKSLLYLGCLLYRKGSKKLGRRRLVQGILINPNASPPTDLNAAEQQLVRAVRCNLSKERTASLNVKVRSNSAEVYINGFLVGFGPQKVTVLPGEYYVKVTLDGYRHWGRRVKVRSGQTRNVRVYTRRSPRQQFYQNFCPKLMKSTESEQLTDEMRKIAMTMHSKRLWVGCFEPTRSGASGKLKWFALNLNSSSKVQRGTASISSSLRVRWNTLGNAIKSLGVRVAPTASAPNSLRLFPKILARSSCLNPDAIKLSPLLPPKRASSAGWLASVGDVIVVYTKYGFRLQGKVLAIEGSKLSLQVAQKSSPPELRTVKIDRSMVKLHWGLGKPQYQGYLIGERLVVQTKYKLNILGVVVSASEKRLRLKTKQGIENLPWSMLTKVVRRDR